MDQDLTFWRTHAGHEVDFLVGGNVAIEVKATRRVSSGDLKGLLALAEETQLRRKIVVAGEPRERTTDQGVTILPVEEFFRQLWDGALIETRQQTQI